MCLRKLSAYYIVLYVYYMLSILKTLLAIPINCLFSMDRLEDQQKSGPVVGNVLLLSFHYLFSLNFECRHFLDVKWGWTSLSFHLTLGLKGLGL